MFNHVSFKLDAAIESKLFAPANDGCKEPRSN